jgi:hypothetical protein
MKAFAQASVLSLALLVSPWGQAAQACSKQSPSHTVALLELYTSEGCSSCPPADRFVSALREMGLSGDRVVPLSLHVDYWDYIGWKDTYGKPVFTERQRWLSNLAASRTVYTPEIFVAGKELRNWQGNVPVTVKRINERPAQANIHIAFAAEGSGGVAIDVTARSALSGQLFVALYESGLASVVRAGENKGATLRHDYVVREWLGPVALRNAGQAASAQLQRTLSLPPGAVVGNVGIAAFVQSDQGEILQALALPMCGGSSG